MMKFGALCVFFLCTLSTASAFQKGPMMRTPTSLRTRGALCVRNNNAFETPVLKRRNGVLPLKSTVGGSDAELQSDSPSVSVSPLMDIAKKAVLALAAFWRAVVAVFLSAVEEIKMFFAKIGMFFSNIFKTDRTDGDSDMSAKATSVSTTPEVDPKAVKADTTMDMDVSAITLGVAAVPAAFLALSALSDAASVDFAVTAAQGAAAVFALTYAMDMATVAAGTFLGTSDSSKKVAKVIDS